MPGPKPHAVPYVTERDNVGKGGRDYMTDQDYEVEGTVIRSSRSDVVYSQADARATTDFMSLEPVEEQPPARKPVSFGTLSPTGDDTKSTAEALRKVPAATYLPSEVPAAS